MQNGNGETREEKPVKSMLIIKEKQENINWWKVVDETGRLLYEHPELWGVEDFIYTQKTGIRRKI